MPNIQSPAITITVGQTIQKKLVGKKIADPNAVYAASNSSTYSNPANPPVSGFNYNPATQIMTLTGSAIGSTVFTLSATNALGANYKIDQPVNVIAVHTFDTLEIVDL